MEPPDRPATTADSAIPPWNGSDRQTRPAGQAAEIIRRFGITPDQWCDRTSLVGDPSDGIRGISGVGTVRAARLLAGGLGIEDLATSGRLVGRVGESISQSLAEIMDWKSIAKMSANCPIGGWTRAEPTHELPLAATVLTMLQLW